MKRPEKEPMDAMERALASARIQVIEKEYDWGIYVWIRENGKPFLDEEGSILNIPSKKNDPEQIKKLKDAATYWGEPNGTPLFYPGLGRVSDEEHSEQVDRMKQGLIPNLNDLGAVHAAQQTIALYGDEE
jgi:hypothetical protein